MTSHDSGAMEAEFDTVAGWTAKVALDLGRDYRIPAACRGSGQPAALDWLLTGLAPDPGDALIDVGAGLGGPAAYAAEQAAVRPVLLEPEPGACRAARRLFGFPGGQGDATRLPFADGSVAVAWCLGVLCTMPDSAAQSAVLRELRRVVRPGGRIGLLVFLAAVPELDDPPEGNHFPTVAGLDAQLGQAGLAILDRQATNALPPHPPQWRQCLGAVESELQRRHGQNPAWCTAEDQSARIGHLLHRGQLESQLLLLSRG
ncbi:MAG TPA: class I SAM-dependent methyltransferase [Streptosporangiaceae bacterium]|jgi:SAM-dependent methyltransferase|nr:class I SAM-dependent methyltransferase [Streptosporangiaceae bacterium]